MNSVHIYFCVLNASCKRLTCTTGLSVVVEIVRYDAVAAYENLVQCKAIQRKRQVGPFPSCTSSVLIVVSVKESCKICNLRMHMHF
jgi:hypothetical protein